MTDEKLREIEERRERARRNDSGAAYRALLTLMDEDVPALLAEVRRLREAIEGAIGQTNIDMDATSRVVAVRGLLREALAFRGSR